MSRFRLLPNPEQEQGLLVHCRDARYVWNLAVEQQQHWEPGRKAPGTVELRGGTRPEAVERACIAIALFGTLEVPLQSPSATGRCSASTDRPRQTQVERVLVFG
jgi:Helix-turn-helix domain